MSSDDKPPLVMQDVTNIAIRCFYDTYNELSGFPEFVVLRGLSIALEDAGLIVQREVPLPVWFRGRHLVTFRADLIIDPGLIVEVKCAPEIEPFHKAQLLHYLKATQFEVGLLFNFGRQPQFARVIYQSARSRRPAELPTDIDKTLEADSRERKDIRPAERSAAASAQSPSGDSIY